MNNNEWMDNGLSLLKFLIEPPWLYDGRRRSGVVILCELFLHGSQPQCGVWTHLDDICLVVVAFVSVKLKQFRLSFSWVASERSLSQHCSTAENDNRNAEGTAVIPLSVTVHRLKDS